MLWLQQFLLVLHAIHDKKIDDHDKNKQGENAVNNHELHFLREAMLCVQNDDMGTEQRRT